MTREQVREEDGLLFEFEVILVIKRVAEVEAWVTGKRKKDEAWVVGKRKEVKPVV